MKDKHSLPCDPMLFFDLMVQRLTSIGEQHQPPSSSSLNHKKKMHDEPKEEEENKLISCDQEAKKPTTIPNDQPKQYESVSRTEGLTSIAKQHQPPSSSSLNHKRKMIDKPKEVENKLISCDQVAKKPKTIPNDQPKRYELVWRRGLKLKLRVIRADLLPSTDHNEQKPGVVSDVVVTDNIVEVAQNLKKVDEESHDDHSVEAVAEMNKIDKESA